jgi:hypothetical protein
MTQKDFNYNDIALAWQKMADVKFAQTSFDKNEIKKAIKMESHLSIAELKKRTRYKLFWSAGFFLLFTTALLFFLGNTDMVLLLGIGSMAYLIGIIPMYNSYRHMEDGLPGSENILKSMKYNAKLIRSVLRLESIWGMIFFTPAILMGILGGRVLDGWTLISCFQDPKTLLMGLIAILIFTPLLIWVSFKMNKYAFGESLRKLEENIIKMETLL